MIDRLRNIFESLRLKDFFFIINGAVLIISSGVCMLLFIGFLLVPETNGIDVYTVWYIALFIVLMLILFINFYIKHLLMFMKLNLKDENI